MFSKIKRFFVVFALIFMLIPGQLLLTSPQAHAVTIAELMASDKDVEARCGELYGRLLGHGYSEESASGKVGNALAESSCNPKTTQFIDGPDGPKTKALGEEIMKILTGDNICELTGGAYASDGRGKGFGYFQLDYVAPYIGCYGKKAGKDITAPATQVEYTQWYDENIEQLWAGTCTQRLGKFGAGQYSAPGSLDGFKKIKDVKEATLVFMACFENPGVPAQEKRVALAQDWYDNYRSKYKSIDPGDTSSLTGGNSDESSDSESSDSDSGTTNIRGGGSTPLAEEDLTGFVKEGVIEGGQDVEIKSSKDLSNEEAMILADHQKYQEMKSFSIANFLLVAFTFMGLWVIIYALTLIGASTIDRVSPLRGLLPLVPILTLGKFNLVYSPEDADPSNGQLTYNSLFVRSLGIALVGVLIAVGVVTGLVSSFFMYFF